MTHEIGRIGSLPRPREKIYRIRQVLPVIVVYVEFILGSFSELLREGNMNELGLP
jgi:hypothetical protein